MSVFARLSRIHKLTGGRVKLSSPDAIRLKSFKYDTNPNIPPFACGLFACGRDFFVRTAELYLHNLVDSSGALDEFDALFPSINDSGVVVFHATFPATNNQPGGEGIYVVDGGSYRGIAVTGGVYQDFFANPTINDKGLVAFEADLSDGSEGVFVGDGKTMGNKTIASSASGRLYQFGLIIRFSDYGLALDGNGNAVFRANLQSSQQRALFAGNGSTQEKQLFPTGNNGTGYPLDPSPAVNATGTVVFLADADIKRTTVSGGTPGNRCNRIRWNAVR